ncbi:MAG TPA: triphosphoribosyl-dephospho-CoA synthase [Methylophilaceae bacterium]|nr:triphosphoribosyl-dephospho-CoA synthase [Methylophilaceae bacterium]
MSAEVNQRAEFAARAFKAACLAELEALKPGNVHIFADGHGMVIQDFIHSAEAATQVIAQPESSVGERILHSIEATQAAVGHNTNLGIVLLCAPMIHAVLHVDRGNLRRDIGSVLDALTVADAVLAYRAILLASPAGLRESPRHDVRTEPQITLLEAMREAGERDLIAQQYANGFADVFEIGVMRYQETLRRWERPAWSATAVYLSFLAEFPDSHIVRKYGSAAALRVREQAAVTLRLMLEADNPKLFMRDLLKFDGELKSQGLNPGTSADLTVATLLAVSLQNADAKGPE